MSAPSAAEAKSRHAQLIDRALEGEESVITRHGHPVVVLKPVAKPAPAVSAVDLDWLAEHRTGRGAPLEDAGRLVTGLRDEGER
jgi:prevent-host-death family protein